MALPAPPPAAPPPEPASDRGPGDAARRRPAGPPAGARTSGLVVGRVAGAPVILTPSSVVAAVVLALVFLPTVRGRFPGLGATAFVVALAFAALLFGSVLVHELAHGLVARRRGQQPREFVLTLWGGHTSFGGAAPTPATSALVAVAGPLANAVLAAAAFAGARLVDPAGLAAPLLWGLGISNAFVAAFNLLPGLPLDGGRILEAAVWGATRDRWRGAAVAARVGMVVAVAVPVVVLADAFRSGRAPSLFSVAWAGLVGAYLFTGARSGLAAARWDRARDGLRLGTVLRPAVVVPHDATVARSTATAAAAGVAEIVVVAPDGRPAAYVLREAALAVPPDAAPTTPVTAVTAPLPVGAVLDGTRTGEDLVAAVAAACRSSDVAAAVVDGQVVGLVRASDVLAVLRGR